MTPCNVKLLVASTPLRNGTTGLLFFCVAADFHTLFVKSLAASFNNLTEISMK